MKSILLVLFVCVFFSCKKDDLKNNQELLLRGKWDSYYTIWENQTVGRDGPAYNILFNYEQGFELFSNKTYLARYIPSNANINTGTWQMEADSLTFKHFPSNISTEEAVRYALVKIDGSELIIKRGDGLTVYLKKSW